MIEIVQTLQLGDISALLPQLRQTVVDAITQTLQSAYKTLPIDYAKKVLMISNDDELNAIVIENEWVVENGYIIFNHNQNDKTNGAHANVFFGKLDPLYGWKPRAMFSPLFRTTHHKSPLVKYLPSTATGRTAPQ